MGMGVGMEGLRALTKFHVDETSSVYVLSPKGYILELLDSELFCILPNLDYLKLCVLLAGGSWLLCICV